MLKKLLLASLLLPAALFGQQWKKIAPVDEPVLILPPPIFFSSHDCSGFDTTITIPTSGGELVIQSAGLLNFPNSYVATDLPDTLPAGKLKNYHLHFQPPYPGIERGVLAIHYTVGGVGFDTSVSITGDFRSTTLLIFPQPLQFNGSVCSGIDTTITFLVQSCSDVYIDSVQLGNIPNSSLTTVIPDTVKSGSSKSIQLLIHSIPANGQPGSVKIFFEVASNHYDTTIFFSVGLQTAASGLILPPPIFFSSPDCQGFDTTITLPNSGCGELIVTSAGLLNFPNSYVATDLPDTLPAGKLKDYHLHFQPPYPGIESGVLAIHYTVGGVGFDTSVSITGDFRSTTVLIFPQPLQFNGSVCSGIDTTITFFVQSCSDVYIDSMQLGNISNSLLTTVLPDTVKSGSSKSIHLLIHSIPTNGQPGSVKIFFGVGSNHYDTTIFFSVGLQTAASGLILPPPIFFTSHNCAGFDTTITIPNSGCGELIIQSAGLLNFPNSYVATDLPDTLAAGKLKNYHLNFQPPTPGIERGVLAIHYTVGGVGFDTSVSITGDFRTRGTINTSMKDILDAGDSIEVPIYLASKRGDTMRGFYLSASFSNDLITPMDPIFRGTLTHSAISWKQNAASLGLTLFVDDSFYVADTAPLVILRFKTYVTFNKCMTLFLDSLQLFDSTGGISAACPLAVSESSITICRNPACGDTTLREFMRTGLAPILGAFYDRATDRISLTDPIKTSHQIEILNVLGEVIRRNTSSGGNLTISANGLTAGIYIIRMTDGARTYSQKISVMR